MEAICAARFVIGGHVFLQLTTLEELKIRFVQLFLIYGEVNKYPQSKIVFCLLRSIIVHLAPTGMYI
jgi:hypothetical protein